MAYLSLENVTYTYPLASEPSLKNLSLSLGQGDFLAIVGKNGSGKTTFCHLLRRFIPDFYKGQLEGKAFFNGKDYASLENKDLVTQIGFVFQNPFTQLSRVKQTVFEEIAFGLENLGIDRQEIIRKVEEVMAFLSIQNLSDKNPQELSGGQMQKVAIASVLVMDTDLLILDEPTSQLDPVGSQEIFDLVKTISESGKTIIMVEHKVELVAPYANKVLVLDQGQIKAFG